jgi:ubiquinol-cytochrome c reductase cytochrome c1 subunit
MPPPLSEGSVTYADGTKPSVEQEATDVAQFLYFCSNPEMEQRKHMGVRMVGFFALMCGLTYAVKRKIWSGVH